MQTGKEKTSNKKILTLAIVLLVALLQPAIATVTITGSLSSDESASGTVYAGIVDFNADPIDWFNTFESTWVGNFSFPANLTNFQAEFFNVNVGNEYYLIVFVDQDSNGNPDTYEIGAIHGPFYLGSTNFNVGDIWLDFGGASGGGGGTGGMIEGTVGSSESTFGTVLVGLFDMPNPSDWNDRVSERNLGSQSFPNYGIWFDFQEEFIFDAGYMVVAFIDENGDQWPNDEEASGMASVTVTGGYGYTGEITMSYGGGGGGGGPTYIQVTSPNSMSNWTTGMGESIDWNSNTSDGMDYDVDIQLYKGGSYYEEIEGGYQSSSFGGNFWWSIPGYLEDGNDYQIRVYHVDSGVGDYSDYFQISGGGGGGPNYIQVTSPNSMSNWTAGSGEPIEWNSSTSDDMDYTVDIELWKSGSYYELIDQDLQSSSSGSSFWWSIPDYLPDGNDYEVRVVHFDSGVDDFSDYFQISGGGGDGPDWIDVTSPVSGSVWFAGSEESISWSSYTPDGSDYYVDIELWRDGNYYQWIVGEYPSNSSADSYQWYIPNNISEGSNYQIRVYPTPYNGVDGYSDYFQISGGGEGGFVSGNLHSDESVSGELIFGLFSPNNGGEEWDPDWWQNQYVTFPSDQYYQFDESGISDGYGYEVRAFVDANSNYSPDPEELQGKSGDFEVLDGFATNIDFDLNYEAGGTGNLTYTIESPQSISGNIYVGVFYDGNPDSSPDATLGPNWHDFATGSYYDSFEGVEEGDNYAVVFFFDGDGSPNSGPENCDEGYDFDYTFYDVDVYGTFDLGTFMLQDCSGGGGEQVTVNYPNGGETFTEGDQMTITWEWTGGSIGLDIYLSQNSGGSFDYFIGSANATDESYNWTIPDGADSPNCRISIEDPGNPSTNDGSDNDFTILNSGGALGEFSTEHAHLYWAAEEESSDTAVVLISNVASDGDLKIEDIYSSEPGDLYPQETEDYPIFIGPGETYGASIVITPPAGPGTWNGTITFELGNATTEIETIDYSVEVYAAGEVDITNSYIDSVIVGFYDLTDQVSMTVDFSSLSSDDGGLFVTMVDGALPANPDGDSPLAVGDRYWEILSNLEDGDFIADLCFDLNDLEGIDDFQSLKILRRTAYSDGTWEEVNSSDIEYDEGNSLICANDQSSFSEWTVGSDSTSGNFVVNPPAISGDIPSSVMEGEDLTFVAQIVAEGGLERALLKYQVGGGNDKEATFIQVSNNNYEATIPGSDVTSRGLIGFIAARDSLQQETFTDTADIQVEFGWLSMGNTSEVTYRMISTGGDVFDKGIATNLEDDLGPYDDTVWRIFKWNGSGYTENNFALEQGEAYWIITQGSATMQSSSGESTPLLNGYGVNLGSGWNMVANPYNFNLSFSNLHYNDGDIEPVLYRYTGSGYTTTNTFTPGDGVWIYANNSNRIDFKPLGGGSIQRTAAEELTWHGSVNVTSGDLMDEDNIFGVAIDASSGWDALDRHEPPVIGDYITLAFDNRDWESYGGLYSRDIQTTGNEGHVWPLSVVTNRAGYATLSVELPDELPLGWELFLVDVAFDIVQNLSTETEYEFVANGSETPREFELIAGPPGFTREALDDLELTPSDYRLAQNIPNPFNALTTIQFNLPKENEVSLAIYDLVGRKVAEPLSNVPYESGGHFVIWDGKDSQNRPVSSGVYLYRLEVSKNGQMEFAKTKKLILLK